MTSRCDMHCHSTASQLSRLGVQRSLGLPECATPPEEVYDLAKRRGMDFVTITDHDTIDGCLELADRPDCFVSEVRNGSRAAELNMPAVVYAETHGSTGIGGSDDHAGVDVGRTWTEVPAAATPEELLAHLRAGRAAAGGEQGSAAKWAHAAMALATRALAIDDTGPGEGAPNPATVLKIAQRVVGQGAVREGAVAADVGPEDARTLLDSWLRSLGIELRGRDLIRHLQSEEFSHADLYRRARRVHDRRLRAATREAMTSVAVGDLHSAVSGVFDALLPAIPYAPPTVFLGAEKAKLATRSGGERPRVALIADGIEAMHGVTHTIEQIRERGVPGFEVEVVGTDPSVDRRLPAATSLDVPFYEGMRLGVPGLPDLAETLAEGRYDLVHVTAPGPSGVAASLLGRVAGTPLVASYHTELAAYAGVRSGDDGLEALSRAALGAFDRAPARVLSPSPAADLFLFCSSTDTYGQVVLEAGASGLPTVAVGQGGPAALIENRHTGILCRPDADHLAGAVLQLASSPVLRARLGEAAVRHAAGRSWERALEQLAAGYRRTLDGHAAALQAASQAA